MDSKIDDLEIVGIYSQDSQLAFGNNFSIYLVTLGEYTYFTFSYPFPLFSHENANLLKEEILNNLNL